MTPALVWAVVLVGVPTAVALALWSTCGAVTRTTSNRCRNLRAGPLHRCQHHRGALAVRSDLYGLLAALLAVAGFLLWRVMHPGPVLPQILEGLMPQTPTA